MDHVTLDIPHTTCNVICLCVNNKDGTVVWYLVYAIYAMYTMSAFLYDLKLGVLYSLYIYTQYSHGLMYTRPFRSL